MKGLNRAYLIGHIGHEPELRTTASGTAVLKLSLATPNARKVNDEWIDTPDWHRLTIFNQEAEFLARHAHKGDTLAVECSIRPNKWTDKENVVHNDVSLIVERVAWLGGRNRTIAPEARTGERAPSRPEASSAPMDGRRAPPSPALDEGDEIPF